MSAEVLAEQGSWRIVAPAERLTDAHLTLARAEPDGPFGYDDAADLITGYRAATSALHRCLGATGFMIGFALHWRPYGDGVGEPAPIDGYDHAVHVFGRRPGEPLSPVRAMARPQRERQLLPPDTSLIERLRLVLAGPPAPLSIEGPTGPRPAEGPAGSRSVEGPSGSGLVEGPTGPRLTGGLPGSRSAESPTEPQSAEGPGERRSSDDPFRSQLVEGPPWPRSAEDPTGTRLIESPAASRSAEGPTGHRPAESPVGQRSAGSSPGAPTVEHPPAPTDEDRSTAPCDGCASSVLAEQERWRADGVRVIRPRRVLIDPHVLVLPLRHVVSLRDLTPDEVVSLVARLKEALGQFRLASGSTGLTGFANDGIAARQETPHVHLHCYGRSVDEPVNPYARLAALLPKPQRPV